MSRNRVNIYTDSRYALLVLHAHAAIWKEKNYLTANRSPIKYHHEIHQLLCAVFLPRQAAIIHGQGHQKGTDEVSEGNRQVAHAAGEAAQTAQPTITIVHLFWEQSLNQIKPQYSQQ